MLLFLFRHYQCKQDVSFSVLTLNLYLQVKYRLRVEFMYTFSVHTHTKFGEVIICDITNNKIYAEMKSTVKMVKKE